MDKLFIPFFDKQLGLWQAAAERFGQLQNVNVKHLHCGGCEVAVQFNPARMVSTGAKIDKASLDKRPCFLCRANRPAEQIAAPLLDRYELLVNPYPILPQHFTIPSLVHEPQSILSRYEDMMRIAAMLDDSLMVFYNGPRCGASAPDHAHFQAGTRSVVPIVNLCKSAEKGVTELHGYICRALVIVADTPEESAGLFREVYATLPVPDGDSEPMMNIIAFQQDSRLTSIIIPRRKHRPDCYFAEGDEQTMVSPGALDMGGLIITPREEDFRKMDAGLARSIIAECGCESEREVSVGVLRAERVEVVFNGKYMLDGEAVTGSMTFSQRDAGKTFHPVSPGSSFTIKNVVIGIDFHWQRREDQTFRGALRLIEEDGLLRAVNVVPVETYLTSVISSEMSANASAELLKAHAVISRSWLMRQIDAKKSHDLNDPDDCNGLNAPNDLAAPIIKWYNSESHTLFDVCADDHCQRYQGITRQTNRNVAAAIEATRGEVLMCDGEVCDARFSKCCGGTMEVFESCWEPSPKRYLVGKEDIVRGETTRNHGVEDAYCNTSDGRILSQVLNNYDQETAHFYRWTVRYTRAELSALVARKSGIDFGSIIDLTPLQRGTSGRITMLKIVGEKRTVTVGKELEIRKWLSESHLYSSAFDVMKDGDTFMLHGRGWGHGVGLCQIGAAVMGERGFTYREILQHYYPNTTICHYGDTTSGAN